MPRRSAMVLAALAAVTLALAPAIADARPGGRFSSGSRGSQTYSAPPSTRTAPGTVRQFDRTETTRPNPAVTSSQPARSTPGGFATRSPLMTGLMGGLLGAGLFGLLAGHGFFGGMAGLAGMFGLLLQIALIAGLVMLVMRLVRRNRPALAGGPHGYAREAQDNPYPRAGGMGAAVARHPVEIGPADYQAFERALLDINAAWSRQDRDALRRLSTPEMAGYFLQDLEDLRARGWTNTTRDVRLEAGDLSEAWNENGQDYATVAMRFSLVDVTTDGTGQVVEGHPSERETATELWTFTRRPGTEWVVSAIQQVE